MLQVVLPIDSISINVGIYIYTHTNEFKSNIFLNLQNLF